MSPISLDTPRALDFVRLDMEYPPWWKCLRWLADGRIESLSVSGGGNEFLGLRVSVTPNQNPQREAPVFFGGVDSRLAAGLRGESAAGGFLHHRGRGAPGSGGVSSPFRETTILPPPAPW